MFAVVSQAANFSSFLALEMAEKLNQIQFSLSNVAQLISDVEAVAALAQAVKDAADAQDLADMQTANNALILGNQVLFSSSGILVALISGCA